MRTATRTGRDTSTRGGRFSRQATPTRRTGPVQGLRRRRAPEPSGIKKLVSSVNPAAARKAVPSSKKGKAGGLALAAAAIGLAIKGRDKLGRGKDTGTPASGTTNSSTPPSQPGV
jgi:hypothetical protein